ncbi:MAG TPA: YdcF family protein, partial [Candidatus Deferrimicrobiaceae bacterium]|nr:YdcF family protein [Candidatus Deferrimicrobiaceae bacterium]
NRIPEGFRAWKEGKARELYILGAGEGARLERVLPGRPALPPSVARNLHLEGWSENTLENAYSAKSVIAEHGFRKVILVTSDYHVPRAYLSFRTILPKTIAVEVIPVRSNWRERGTVYRTLRLFFVEGWKYWGYRIFLYWE